ncbi:MAG: S41 family peptidase [Pseudomonadota bacterium]
MPNPSLRSFAFAALIASASFLVACGGGGGGGSSTPPPTVTVPPPSAPPPPTSFAPTWTPGVFEPSGNFQQFCATPRSGVDAGGTSFPDQPGSLAEELFWLRSWTDETYLWNDDVIDRDPNTFSDQETYFDLLKTNAITPSGKERDDFHFSEPTSVTLARRTSAPSAGYGATIVAFSRTPPRDFRVIYTEQNSPAAQIVSGQPNLRRGARILTIDGVDLVNADTQSEIDTLNAGLFPETAGETRIFEVLDPGASSSRSVLLTSADIVDAPVNRTTTIDTPTGKVGYVLFNTFSPFAAEEAIATAITEMQSESVTDLVLDLRYNGGGLLAIASQLGYMIAGPAQTQNKAFNRDIINDNPNNPLRAFNPVTPFYSTGQDFTLARGTLLPSLNLDRVYVLSTGDTCSASESVINALRGIDVEVILIGDTTCGKPFGFFATDNCGITYYTIQFQASNDRSFGAYADGFYPANASQSFGVEVPGCLVADDLNTELGDPSEGLLAAALEYRASGTCPPIAPVTTKSQPISIALKPGMTEVATTRMTASEREIVGNMRIARP